MIKIVVENKSFVFNFFCQAGYILENRLHIGKKNNASSLANKFIVRITENDVFMKKK